MKEAQGRNAGIRFLFHITVETAVGMLKEIELRMQAGAGIIWEVIVERRQKEASVLTRKKKGNLQKIICEKSQEDRERGDGKESNRDCDRV